MTKEYEKLEKKCTTLVITSKELSSNGSLGFRFRSCTTYSVRTWEDKISALSLIRFNGLTVYITFITNKTTHELMVEVCIQKCPYIASLKRTGRIISFPRDKIKNANKETEIGCSLWLILRNCYKDSSTFANIRNIRNI